MAFYLYPHLYYFPKAVAIDHNPKVESTAQKGHDNLCLCLTQLTTWVADKLLFQAVICFADIFTVPWQRHTRNFLQQYQELHQAWSTDTVKGSDYDLIEQYSIHKIPRSYRQGRFYLAQPSAAEARTSRLPATAVYIVTYLSFFVTKPYEAFAVALFLHLFCW